MGVLKTSSKLTSPQTSEKNDKHYVPHVPNWIPLDRIPFPNHHEFLKDDDNTYFLI